MSLAITSYKNYSKMIEYENYQKNLDIINTPCLKDLKANKSVCYSGDLGLIRERKESEDYVKSDQSLAIAVAGVNNTAAPLLNISKKPVLNAWADIDAQELFLNSKPTCYLILGKPGTGAYSLGEALSKKYHCIHLCPKTMIFDEMAQNSSTGKCINFNMRHNKPIKHDLLLQMLKIKLQSVAIQHRGYVISGFPLVTTSKSSQYLLDSLFGEEALDVISDLLFNMIANLNKKKAKQSKKLTSLVSSATSDTVINEEEKEEEEEAQPEEDQEEEEDIKVELPKFVLNTCSDVIHPIKPYYNIKKAILLQQLETVCTGSLKPDIILYITSTDKDAVTRKLHKYINYKNNQNVADNLSKQLTNDMPWPPKYTTRDYNSPIASHMVNLQYRCIPPMNYEHKSVEQLCNYRNDVSPFIEKILHDFDPKYIIKIDARLSLSENMHHIANRFLLMAIAPVILPEPIRMEEPPEDMSEFWNSIRELNVIQSNDVAFRRSASLWSNRCPVELKKRCSVIGKPKLAVAFLKYVYIPASLDNMILFCRNPRPYLKLKYLEPTCRVIVMGTKLSGKTMIAECLSWLFDSPIISYNEVVQNEATKKYDIYAKRILSEIIATIEDARLEKWNTLEIERLTQLNQWCKYTIKLLAAYIPHLQEYIRLTPKKKIIHEESSMNPLKDNEEVEEQIEESEASSIEELDSEFLNEFNDFRSHLSFLPFLDDIDLCNDALTTEVMTQYAPAHLSMPEMKPNLPTMNDEDVKEAISVYIVANELQQEIQPTIEELMNELIFAINSIDAERQKYTNNDEMYGKYIIDGFPSNPECWSILEDSKLLPDYTVVLIENREIDSDLLQYYKDAEDASIKNNHEKYITADDPLIKLKLTTKQPLNTTELDMKIIMYDIINEKKKVAEDTEVEIELSDAINEAPWISFADEVEKFKEDWDNVKLKLEEQKTYIDVMLENKTDIQVIEEVLMRLRRAYIMPCEINEDVKEENQYDENEILDLMTYNNPEKLGCTGTFCPISYYDHGVLWEGNPEFSIKYDDRIYRLCKEEFLDPIQKDISRYQSYNKPYKTLPPLRICVIGCIGSGKTAISKFLSKELGLMHIDFVNAINDFLLPKHFKKVGLDCENVFTDTPIDDEAVTDFQVDEDENNLFDIMSNETELRKLLYNYFERGTPVLPQIMQKLITKLWFQEPFATIGFILDGYPRLPTDVEDMTACFCIPDLIIEIEGSIEKTLDRVSPIMVKKWKAQLSEMKQKVRQKFNASKEEWMAFLTKNIVVKLICEDILDQIFPILKSEIEGSNTSIMMAVDAIDTNLLQMYNEMIQEYPEPVDESKWESTEDARERIVSRLEGIYESEDENIQSLKDLLEEQRIKIVSVPGNKALFKVQRFALTKLKNLRNRGEAIFEQTIIVNADIAEILISSGYCLLSKFYRMCPVYIFENPHTIQNIYSVAKQNNAVFPIIHRFYVYFVYGEKNVKKFRTNPLMYITSDNICKFTEFPLKICIIGAPKSGKSTLAAKLAKRYGLLCFSKGIACREVIPSKEWTGLAYQMSVDLNVGAYIDPYLITRTERTVLSDYRTYTNGYVLDSIPETSLGAMELVRIGYYPNIVFDISAKFEKVLENSQKEVYYEIVKRTPPYSPSFIENRYKKWQENSHRVRDWINNNYQNAYVIDGNKSKWECFQNAVNIINDVVPKIHNYLLNVKTSIVPAFVMSISNEMFFEKKSRFRNLCPVCLHINEMKHNLFPIEKKGVVQYKDKYYWICSRHLEVALLHPEFYLTSQNIDVPEPPVIVKNFNMSLVHESGVCIVTYAENLPAQIIVNGSRDCAASYKGKRYLFCSNKCLEKFLTKPHMYYDIRVSKHTKSFPSVSVQGLPHIGYLEQTVGNLITDACCSVNVLRPKYPGLTFPMSGLLYIALYLKVHNPLTDKAFLQIYKTSYETYKSRCRLINNVAMFLRSMDNPFAAYPVCCKPWKECKYSTITKPSSTTDVSYPSRTDSFVKSEII